MKSLVFIVALLVASCQAPLRNAEAQSTNFYDARGNKIGSATTTGKTTNFYDDRGSRVQSSTRTGNTTNYYDPRGNKVGSTTTPSLGNGSRR